MPDPPGFAAVRQGAAAIICPVHGSSVDRSCRRDDQAVELGLPGGVEVALDRLAHDVRARSALAGAVGVETLEQPVGHPGVPLQPA
jgi:hypothetical protein